MDLNFLNMLNTALISVFDWQKFQSGTDEWNYGSKTAFSLNLTILWLCLNFFRKWADTWKLRHRFLLFLQRGTFPQQLKPLLLPCLPVLLVLIVGCSLLLQVMLHNTELILQGLDFAYQLFRFWCCSVTKGSLLMLAHMGTNIEIHCSLDISQCFGSRSCYRVVSETAL